MVHLSEIQPEFQNTLRRFVQGLAAFLQRDDVRELAVKFVALAIEFPEIPKGRVATFR